MYVYMSVCMLWCYLCVVCILAASFWLLLYVVCTCENVRVRVCDRDVGCSTLLICIECMSSNIPLLTQVASIRFFSVWFHEQAKVRMLFASFYV
jgi:hypothetical protein